MTSELTSNDPPNDFEMVDNIHIDGEEDARLAAMLVDAYDAPPVPKSLTKRLDAGISQQWGFSPELDLSQNKATLAGTKRLAAQTLWFVGAAAATLMFVVMIAGGTGNYAWATVVDAMARHGLIQVEDGDGTRWLDLSRQVVCQHSDQVTRWLDFRKRLVITRSGSKGRLHREPLLLRSDAEIQNDVLLAAFLLKQPLTAESIERFRDVKVVGERWQKTSHQGTSLVELEIDFATQDDQRFELTLKLDPESRLPRAIESSDLSTRTASLNYSHESIEQLQARLLADDAGLALNGTGNDTADDIAAVDRSRNSMAKLNGDKTNDPAVNQNADPRDLPTETSEVTAPAKETSSTLVAALPIGAANKWKPVAVIPRSDDEVQLQIDTLLEQLWANQQTEPVRRADDLQLLRRAYLDLAGRTPSVNEVRRFLDDPSENRYKTLVDHLLESPDHASQMAAVWRSFLIPEGVDLNAFGGRETFEKWLTERFANDEPYDQIVRKLLLAEGRLSQSGPLLFYSALKLNADQLAARTSRVFLGMRLECAQCHDHPFEPWKQRDFWSYAAFFAQISRPKGQLENVSTVMRVQDVDRGEVMLPETKDIIEPQFLGESSKTAADASEPLSPRRQRLAEWLTGPDNPYFARATVNRVWSHMFGRGIVDPVDDFGANNQPVSPELLDTLASQFIDSGFNLKTLIRSIALSRAYQLSSSSDQDGESPAEVAKRLKLFAQMNVKTLTAEQLYDCIAVATLLDPQNTADSQYTLARFGNSDREQFLQQFASPTTSRSEYLAGIPQALMLMNGSLTSQATGEGSSGLIQSLDAPFFTDYQRINVLFMATLSRPALPNELELMKEFVRADATTEQRRVGLADLLWVLINSSEFALNH